MIFRASLQKMPDVPIHRRRIQGRCPAAFIQCPASDVPGSANGPLQRRSTGRRQIVSIPVKNRMDGSDFNNDNPRCRTHHIIQARVAVTLGGIQGNQHPPGCFDSLDNGILFCVGHTIPARGQHQVGLAVPFHPFIENSDFNMPRARGDQAEPIQRGYPRQTSPEHSSFRGTVFIGYKTNGIHTVLLYPDFFDLSKDSWQIQHMKLPRLLTLVFVTGLLVIAVALQTEKPSVQLQELRPHRLATHFRAVRFTPGTDIAWAAGFDGAVCRTTDAGRTWTMQSVPVSARFYGMHVLDRRNVWICGSEGTLLRTSNGGKSWNRVSVPTRLRLLDVCFIDPQTGWVAGDHGLILKTGDGGKQWRVQTTGITSGFRRIWFGNPQQGYAVGYEGVALRTTNGGIDWNRIETPEHISFYGADFHTDARQFHLVGSCGMILASDDAGETCRAEPMVTTNFLRDVDFDGAGRGVAAGYGVLLRYDPAENRWIRQQNVPGLYLQSVALGEQGRGIAVGRWGSLLRTDDAGRTWQFNTQLFAPDLHAICGDRTGALAAGGADGWVFIRSRDGAGWNPEYTGARNSFRSAAVDPKGRIWMAGDRKTIVRRSTDTTWQAVPVPAAGDLNDICFSEDSLGYIAGDNGVILRSEDAGDTWTPMPPPGRFDIHSIRFLDRDHGFITGETGIIMETTNGGQTWLGHYTGVDDRLGGARFSREGHAAVTGMFTALESWSNGHNSSWFEVHTEAPVTAFAPGCRYAALRNGDILDRRTGIARCTATDPIYDFYANHTGNSIWGAGRFGRLIALTTSDIHLKVRTNARRHVE